MKILWIPHAGWHIPQRAHLFCRALAPRHEVHVTDWVADFSSPRHYLSTRYIRNFTYRHAVLEGIHVHGIPRLSPALFFPALRRLNTRVYADFVRRIIAEYKIDVVVGSFVVPPPQAPRLVFDVFDDNADYWRSYRKNESMALEIQAAEDAYIEKADAIVAVGSVLKDKVLLSPRLDKSRTAKVHLIPNAVALESFRLARGDRVRQEYSLENRKVIGFISGLGEFSGLQKLLQSFHLLAGAGVHLLIVGDGPALKPAEAWANKNGLRNVVFTGRVPFSEIPDYFAALDVGVIPFDKTPFTDSACPIKLIEYSAAGKNVVSTDLEEVRRMAFPNVTMVEDNALSLADGLRHALSAPFLQPPQLVEYDLPFLVPKYEAVLAGE